MKTAEISESAEKRRIEYPDTNLTEKIIAAAIEVHRILGPGFGEDVYEEALAHELKLRDILFEHQKNIKIPYKANIAKTYRIDFLVDNKIIVEIKAVSELSEIHEAQVLSYLKASNMQIGLLINFNVKLLRNGIKRIILSRIK